MSEYSERVRSTIIDRAIGRKFGKLKVLSFNRFHATRRGKRVPMVNVSCVCGNLKVVSLWDVRSGKTRTCGYKHPHYEDRSMPAFNQLYDHIYRRRALKLGLTFTITRKRFRFLVQQPCHYCGVGPINNATVRSGTSLSVYTYNGLDRKNPKGGYTLKNVVPCCGICNHAKHILSYDVFIAWLDRLIAFRAAQ